MKRCASLVCWLGCLCWLSAVHAQNVRVMQWNVLGGLGNQANNSSAQAKAIARIINYNQPDILLFNEVDASGLSAAQNEAAIIDFVTNNVPYLGTQPGTTFFVKASTQTDSFIRNAAISRYPILTEGTYNDGLRGLHSFKVQLTGANVLQVFHTHLKCCADDCTRKQTEAQFDADTMSGWALTNAGPYIYGGDLNEDEQKVPPVCTLSATYHPITTIREDGEVVEFKPTTLSGEYRTWSTADTTPSIRFDYLLAATNRLTATSGYVFSTKDWAAHGLYTNASPQNLVGDTATASDHYCVFVNYFFPTAASGMAVTPTNDLASAGNQGGPFAPSSQVYNVANTNAASLNWTVSKTAAWVTLSATNGTLTSGANTNITVSINATANSLTPNVYNDTVTFRDLAAVATVTRNINLTVTGLPTLTVTPSSVFSSSGQPGGPFSPSSQNYTLSNPGNSALNWTASSAAAWLTISPAGGTLASGASTTVVATINTSANALPAGAYAGTIGFTNTTNGAGNTTRSANLTISTFGFIDRFSTFAAGNLVGQNNWLQVAGSSSSPLQVSGGQLVVPGLPINGSDAQDAYKSFGSEVTVPASGTNKFYYAISITVTSAATNPGYILATTNQTGAANFPNFRFTARDNGGNFSFGGRVNAQNGYPFFYGAGLNYGTEYAVICEANLIAGNANDVMRLYVNPTSSDINAQSPYATATYTSGTVSDPPSEGALIVSQFTSATIGQDGVRMTRLIVADSFAAAYNALFVPANFTVSPAGSLTSSGPQGGPFTPGSQVYNLSNTGGGALNWTVSVSNNWLSLSITSGSLAAGANTNLTVSTNANANALVGGLYSNLVAFVNATNGAGSTNRWASLLVRDGIPDAWRLQYFGHIDPRADDLSRAGDDADGDGFTNLQEYLDGTDPRNSSSSFRITDMSRAADGTVTITWNSVATKTYRVQYKDDPTAISWSDLAGDITAAGASASKTDPAGGTASARTYRVLLLP